MILYCSYTSIASAETISAPSFRANKKLASVFPVAVGPTIKIILLIAYLGINSGRISFIK